jgi:hypothetical protein
MSYTPLQLIAASGILSNTGVALPTSMVESINTYNTANLIAPLLSTAAAAETYGLNVTARYLLQTLASNSCPALSASVPTAYANATTSVSAAPVIPPAPAGGFGNLIVTTGNRYLGNGDLSKFAQVFSAVTGFQSQSTDTVYSAVNATTYMGPTFTNMNNLITGDITAVTLAIPAFAQDVAELGQAFDLGAIAEFGTPAALLRQLSNMAEIVRGTIPPVETALLAQGLTPDEIDALCTPTQSDLVLTQTQLNSLQQRAYRAMVNVVGDDLVQVLAILRVTTPDINTMADLLNIQKLFPRSWQSLTTPVDGDAVLIFEQDGAVNDQVTVYVTEAVVTGCDQLAKIVPPEQAVAATALSQSLQQIGNLSQLTLPELAGALL